MNKLTLYVSSVLLAGMTLLGCADSNIHYIEIDASQNMSAIEEITSSDPVNTTGTDHVSDEASSGHSQISLENFDVASYEHFVWNLADISETVQMKIHGYYGELIVAGSKQGMLISAIYNIPHLAEIKGNAITADSGTQSEIFISPDDRIYLYDATQNNKKPKMIYFDADSTSSSLLSTDEDAINISSMLGNDITYNGFKEEIQEGDKITDVCLITFTDENGVRIPCNAYIDRQSQKLLKIVKDRNEDNPHDFSMIIAPVSNDKINAPKWTQACRRAGDDQIWDLMEVLMSLNILMSDQDLTDSVLFSDLSSNTVVDQRSDNDTPREQKIHSGAYWEDKLGSYSGYYSFDDGAEVYVYDGDENEHIFIWDEQAQDYIPKPSK